jgi:hypothetical protein
MFDKKQRDFLISLGLKLDFDNLSDDDLDLIEDTVADKLEISGFDLDYEPTEIGLMCESILDELA